MSKAILLEDSLIESNAGIIQIPEDEDHNQDENQNEPPAPEHNRDKHINQKSKKNKGKIKPSLNIEQEEEEIIFTEVFQAHTGASFGELALIGNKPRAARIRTLTECHFVVMTKHEFNRCLAKIENKTRIRTIQFLSEIPFFAQLSKTQLGKLLVSFNTIRYKRGNILFREGEPNEDIFIVRTGEF